MEEHSSFMDFDCIYIEFDKAFDCVSHTKLIFRLSQIGINGCIFNGLQISYLVGDKKLWLIIEYVLSGLM